MALGSAGDAKRIQYIYIWLQDMKSEVGWLARHQNHFGCQAVPARPGAGRQGRARIQAGQANLAARAGRAWQACRAGWAGGVGKAAQPARPG